MTPLNHDSLGSTVARTIRREPKGSRRSLGRLLDSWRRRRDLQNLHQQRQARTAAFDHFAQEVVQAVHRDHDHWARAVALCAIQVNRIGMSPWFWHAILRRAYRADRAIVGACQPDWSRYTAQDLRNLPERSLPMVQRWLWVAVHAQDLWLTERTLVDGARANAVLTLPDARRLRPGRSPELMPMTWLLDAHQHGGTMAAWVRATDVPIEAWPDAWRFWWSSAREVDDPAPMLRILGRPRRGEDLHHHGYPPSDEDLLRWAQAADQHDLRTAIEQVMPSAAVPPPPRKRL